MIDWGADTLSWLLLGVGGGAVLAALALGLVLTYQSSGVVNFAHAATGVFFARAFYEFRETGDLVFPILGLPDRVHVLDAPTVATAFLLIIPMAALVGAADLPRRLPTAPHLPTAGACRRVARALPLHAGDDRRPVPRRPR